MATKIFLVFQENNMEGVEMIDTKVYEIIDDNSGEGFETYYDAARELQTSYKERHDLTVKLESEKRWCIVRKKDEGF